MTTTAQPAATSATAVGAARDDAQPCGTRHLEGRWSMWSDSALRMAGFAFEPLLTLAAPGLLAHPDAHAEQTTADFATAYADAVARATAALEEIVDDERFRTALRWQNPELLDWCLDPWLAEARNGEATSLTGRRRRRWEQRSRTLVAYAQRYHARNESVGFFGPVGWVRWAGADDGRRAAFTVEGQGRRLEARHRELEHWVVQALADQISADPACRDLLRPRRSALVSIDGDRTWTLGTGWITLPPQRREVLRACDGRHTVREIARDLVAREVPGVRDVDDVHAALRALGTMRLVTTRLEVPPTPYPERWLREVLAGSGDPAASDALQVLDDLVVAASTIGEPGEPDVTAEQLLTERLGIGPHRSPDQAQRGRGVAVENCRSTLRLEVSDQQRADLAGPLTSVLTMSRWLVHAVGERYLQVARELHAAAGGGRQPFAPFLLAFGERCAPDSWRPSAQPVIDELQARAAAVFALDPHQHRQRFDPEQVRALVDEHFTAPSVSWLSGGYHSPDLLVAAGPSGLDDPETTWVLGELHAGTNTLDQGVFVTTHPEPSRLAAQAALDVGARRWVLPAYPSDLAGVSSRAYPPPYHVQQAHDYVVVSTEPTRDGVEPAQELVIGDLELDEDETGLVVEHRDGRRWPLMAVVGDYLTTILGDLFQPFAPAAHRPRVSVGSLTVVREQWRVPRAQLASWLVREPVDAFRAVNRWATANGVPRFVFARCDGAAKPVYVDLASPPLVDALVVLVQRMIRLERGDHVVLTEMHPGPDELWAPFDDAGSRCTSEIRIAVVDGDRGR